MESIPVNELLSREPNQDYLNEWAVMVQKEKKIRKPRHDFSLLLFRIHHEWFGLSTAVFNHVSENKGIHSIPFKKSPFILGLVNIGGQIRICVTLDKLLNISGQEKGHEELSSVVYDRMIVIEREDYVWVFPVDEVYGIFQFDAEQMENVPVNISKSSANYLKGIFSWKGKRIGFLDEELLCYSLKTSI